MNGSHHKKELYDVIRVLANTIVVTVLQYIIVSNQHLELAQWYMSIIAHFLKNSHGCQPGKQKPGVLRLGELTDTQGPAPWDLDVIAP